MAKNKEMNFDFGCPSGKIIACLSERKKIKAGA